MTGIGIKWSKDYSFEDQYFTFHHDIYERVLIMNLFLSNVDPSFKICLSALLFFAISRSYYNAHKIIYFLAWAHKEIPN